MLGHGTPRRALGALRSASGTAARRLLELLLRVLPTRPHAVVHGVPDHEGNAVEVVRHLLQHYPGRVYWLVSGTGADVRWELAGVDQARLRQLPKSSPRAVLAYLTAELVFFTHGLFGSPEPPPGRTFVNLWHGDGPKRTGNTAFDAKIRSSLLVACTREFGARKAAGLGVDGDRVAVTGNPRIDQFDRPATPEQLAALDLPADRPLVVWAPTYRAASGGGGPSWSDSSRLSSRSEALADVERAAVALEEAGGRLVVKPHMLDADNFRVSGLTVLVDADLAAAGLPFYSLLGSSAALVTDYSSIWTDYLALHRPIGYFCPDLEEYRQGRGFHIDFMDWLAGPLLRDADALQGFLVDVARGQDPGAVERRSVAERLGAVTELGATDRLMARVLR